MALEVLYRLHDPAPRRIWLAAAFVTCAQPTPKDSTSALGAYVSSQNSSGTAGSSPRFRTAHVSFGLKTIEVATFRKNVPAGTESESPAEPIENTSGDPDLQIKHDNTFGTPEEDAFRRDFTVNALFYDIANFSIIDYVGGLQDLKSGLIRCIGDPNERFQEDPVRMLRAIVMASRLSFKLDPPIVDAIARHRGLMATASPSRLIEEYYKILRSGTPR